MSMQCENCGERPAEIHLTQIVDNQVSTSHLCNECAASKGIQTSASVAKFPLSDFLASMGEAGKSVSTDEAACTTCGATLEDFRKSGRLGCPDCYGSFGLQLRDLLRRLHGSTRHVGEVYLSPSVEEADRDQYLEELREQLERAVGAENFELAAELRDRIKAFE